MITNHLKNLMFGLGAFVLVSCGGGGSSISVLPSLDEFEQSTNTDIKIDVLFVIDDSGSMAPGQQELQQNFQSFIQNFANKGYDFNIAVGRTSSYGGSGGNRTAHEFHCGAGNNCPADAVLSSSLLTYNEIVNKFVANANVGTGGTGTERGIRATKEILDDQTSGVNFPRAGAHLAVVHVGDENDDGSFGWSGLNDESDYLADLEDRGADGVSVHAIEVTGDPDCKANHGTYGGGTGTIHNAASAGTDFYNMADLSDGLKLSICEPFAGSLSDLGDQISSLASAFELTDILDQGGIDTLQVYVEGINGNNPLPDSSSNGYTYDAPSNSVIFHGSMVPPQGAIIGVTYTCTQLDCNN